MCVRPLFCVFKNHSLQQFLFFFQRLHLNFLPFLIPREIRHTQKNTEKKRKQNSQKEFDYIILYIVLHRSSVLVWFFFLFLLLFLFSRLGYPIPIQQKHPYARLCIPVPCILSRRCCQLDKYISHFWGLEFISIRMKTMKIALSLCINASYSLWRFNYIIGLGPPQPAPTGSPILFLNIFNSTKCIAPVSWKRVFEERERERERELGYFWHRPRGIPVVPLRHSWKNTHAHRSKTLLRPSDPSAEERARGRTWTHSSGNNFGPPSFS